MLFTEPKHYLQYCEGGSSDPCPVQLQMSAVYITLDVTSMHLLLQVAGLVLVTITTMFLAARYFGRCVQVPEDWAEDHYGFRFTCPQGKARLLYSVTYSNKVCISLLLKSTNMPGQVSAYGLGPHLQPC